MSKVQGDIKTQCTRLKTSHRQTSQYPHVPKDRFLDPTLSKPHHSKPLQRHHGSKPTLTGWHLPFLPTPCRAQKYRLRIHSRIQKVCYVAKNHPTTPEYSAFTRSLSSKRDLPERNVSKIGTQHNSKRTSRWPWRSISSNMFAAN